MGAQSHIESQSAADWHSDRGVPGRVRAPPWLPLHDHSRCDRTPVAAQLRRALRRRQIVATSALGGIYTETVNFLRVSIMGIKNMPAGAFGGSFSGVMIPRGVRLVVRTLALASWKVDGWRRDTTAHARTTHVGVAWKVRWKRFRVFRGL